MLPWWRYTRTVFAGDLPSDIQALDYCPDDCAPAPTPCNLAWLSQDRAATYWGVRTAYFSASPHHALKFGADWSVENFNSNEQIAQLAAPPFLDNTQQTGNIYSVYAEDKWTPSRIFSMQFGLRYDRSTGFVDGNSLQPRIGANFQIGPNTIVHGYYGRIYAAPALEDTRREAVVIGGGSPSDLPVYDLKPESDSYYELGLAQTFRNGLYGYINAWRRNSWNVLDTTQIYPTPIFAVFNNAVGIGPGTRADGSNATDCSEARGTSRGPSRSRSRAASPGAHSCFRHRLSRTHHSSLRTTIRRSRSTMHTPSASVPTVAAS